MVKKRTSTRSRARSTTARKPASPVVRRAVFALVRRVLIFSCPRTASQLLALILTVLVLALGSFIAFTSLERGSRPGLAAFWCVALVMLALAARVSPWWRAELRDMTRERARNYTGSALLLFVVLSFSWHVVSTNLGVGDAYLLLGPFSTPPGAFAVLVLVVVIAFVLLLDIPLADWSTSTGNALWSAVARARARQLVDAVDVDNVVIFEPAEEETETKALQQVPAARNPKPTAASTVSLPAPSSNRDALPPISLFLPPPKAKSAPIDLEQNARRIEETLASFGVGARVVDTHSGPVVTQFDVQPERGVKVRRITELQNDLALALAAPTIRIQAPVPGRPVVGIEIPNTAAVMVALRELLESDDYQGSKSPLRMALGKDVAGNPKIIDLARMPHLLIAGATGSGKSICINALISCLLYQNKPDQVRIMLVDPKMVELTVYNGVPHLLSPVVTQMDKVVGVLQWALREMERRYQLFADNTVRNIDRYNEKVAQLGQKRLPYIVLVVDELADLMMVAPEDVEDAICRLAQLARAAGIHLVIATQRPSVDVVTGLIKANFPARIAFAMTSQVDSRTILDTAGAEKLLGRGDMLYLPPDAPKPIRLQGAFLSDQEIERLVEFWQRSPLQQVVTRVGDEEFVAAQKAASEVDDELLGEAIRVVREYQHASVSLLQRRLKVGYARAARLMDQLEEHNVVAAADGSKQRAVLDRDTPFGS